MKKNNYFNTFEYLKKEIEEQKDYENYPVRSDLEGQYQAIEAFHGLPVRSSLEDGEMTPLEQFTYLIDCGLYPPPEVMFAVRECFEYHRVAAGRLSLDDVFLEPGSRGKGTQAKQNARTLEMDVFHLLFERAKNRAKNESKKIPTRAEFAELYLNKNPKIQSIYIDDEGNIVGQPSDENTDVDTFLRKYRRWLKKFSDK